MGTEQHALAIVHLGAWKADGSPVPRVESAVCAVCGGWATHLWTSTVMKSEQPSNLLDVRISRSLRVVVYTCDDHSEQVADDLVQEYGYTSNRFAPDHLAIEVQSRGGPGCDGGGSGDED